jgi:copper chaperone CopZ
MKGRLVLTMDDLWPDGDASRSIERCLLSQSGVTRVFVSTVTEAAYVEYDPAVVSPIEIVETVRAAGFRAENASLR